MRILPDLLAATTASDSSDSPGPVAMIEVSPCDSQSLSANWPYFSACQSFVTQPPAGLRIAKFWPDSSIRWTLSSLCSISVAIGNSKLSFGTSISKAFSTSIRFLRITCVCGGISTLRLRKMRLAGSRRLPLSKPYRIFAPESFAIAADFRRP